MVVKHCKSVTYFEDLGEGLYNTRFFVAEDLYRVNEYNLGHWSIAEQFEDWSVFLLVRIRDSFTSDKPSRLGLRSDLAECSNPQ